MSRQGRYDASVTFEFDDAKPETVKVAIVAATASGAVRRAVVAAQRAKPGMHFRSLVVILERGSRTDIAREAIPNEAGVERA